MWKTPDDAMAHTRRRRLSPRWQSPTPLPPPPTTTVALAVAEAHTGIEQSTGCAIVVVVAVVARRVESCSSPGDGHMLDDDADADDGSAALAADDDDVGAGNCSRRCCRTCIRLDSWRTMRRPVTMTMTLRPGADDDRTRTMATVMRNAVVWVSRV